MSSSSSSSSASKESGTAPGARSAFALGHRALVGYLAFLSAFVPLSTDLYLPALPGMSQFFQAPPELTSLTLSCFMLIYSLSMLAWGPLSDKYGRRPILLAGLVIYIGASIGSALCGSVHQLIVGRCFQALGSGAISAVSLTVVKDAFRGRAMENVLTLIQTMIVLAPMLAPVIGGLLLTVTSWRGIFWALALCGAVALGLSFALRETLTNPTPGSALGSLGRVIVVLRHTRFRSLLAIFSLSSMPFMAYLAASSYVFIDTFKVSPQAYSWFFAVNAGVSMFGPLLYARFLRELPRRAYIAGNFLICAAAGALLLLMGGTGPLAFAALYMPITFCGSAIRPPATMLMMNQMDTDTGTVASLIGSVSLLCGSLAMFLCSLPWNSFITAAGSISTAVSLICLAGWLRVSRAGEQRA